jgi:hypothetical protein
VSVHTVFTFNELVENIEAVNNVIKQGQKNLSKEKIDELLEDLPKHNSFRYINKGSLTDEYFDMAYKTLDDSNIYNGGEKIYPPGLNMEMVKYFNNKTDIISAAHV